ncbi:DNA polymerase Y family protein [Marinihelvus fidelis]|uniref:DNA polymerase Y family protein n=1 Tax=Marinihelvus fidelis TaxID=2613842 RepID=A0A5N0TAP7_9GAMM|nr:DNA polymerase Y family protein [Marinihelvus fidelis]KAA9132042.1 DNA polymerase Y family protein [Marinihelvus fidelis]
MPEAWLAVWLPRLALDLVTRAGQPAVTAMAITEAHRGRAVIVDMNDPAAGHGVRPGMPVTAALGLCGELVLRERNLAAEEQALQRLAAWAYQYSSRVSVGDGEHVLYLEAGASQRLFGAAAALASRLADELAALGYQARTGTAPTPAAARLAARLGQDIADREQLEQCLARLPLEQLDLSSTERRSLLRMGFRTTGEILGLPRAELARRLDPPLLARLDRLRGLRPDPRPAWHPSAHYRAHLDLAAEVHQAQGLLFPLQRMVQELCGVLRGGDQGIQQLDIRLALRKGRHRFSLGLQSPGRDEARMVSLLRERLEHLRLPSPALAIDLHVARLLPFEAPAGDLFGQAADDEAGDSLRTVLERLGARLGDAAITGLGGVEEHRPEYSWTQPPPGEDSPCPALPHRPTWLCQPPRRCDVGQYRVLAGPERIEAGWWDGHDCRRDYYVMRDPDGATVWVYREFKPAPGWYLQGIFG